MPEADIIVWDHEPYYGSPATKTVQLSWEGDLKKAVLNIDVDPYAPGWPFMGGCIKRIIVNNNQVSFTGDPCDKVSADITEYLRKGYNEIAFEHNPCPIPGIQSGGCYAYIHIETTGKLSTPEIVRPAPAPKPLPTLPFGLTWWDVAKYGAIAGATLIGAALIIKLFKS